MAKIAKKDIVGNVVKFEFSDGETLECDVRELPTDIIDRLALHGIAQKIGDSYAGAESIADAKENATATWAHLVAGIWASRASGGGKLAEALHRATGQPLDVCVEKLAGMDDKEKAALRRHPQVKQALAEMELERAQAGAAHGSDLGELFE